MTETDTVVNNRFIFESQIKSNRATLTLQTFELLGYRFRYFLRPLGGLWAHYGNVSVVVDLIDDNGQRLEIDAPKRDEIYDFYETIKKAYDKEVVGGIQPAIPSLLDLALSE